MEKCISNRNLQNIYKIDTKIYIKYNLLKVVIFLAQVLA